MHFYSIHVIAEYDLSGSEIICRQIFEEMLRNDAMYTLKPSIGQP